MTSLCHHPQKHPQERLRKRPGALLASGLLALVLAAAVPSVALAQENTCSDHDTYDPALVAQAQRRLASDQGISTFSVPGAEDLGLATVGQARFAAIRISFPAADDGSEPAMTIPADQTAENFQAAFNGGDAGPLAGAFPYENLHNYYLRASYGKFDASCAVVANYTAQHNRSYYAFHLDELFYEALAGVDSQVDFSQCDANNDGFIDGVYFQYAGDTGSWGSTWWPKETYISSAPAGTQQTFDGKTPRAIVMMNSDVENHSTANGFAATLIHETGHVLGLPDLYNAINPSLGLRSYGLMNNNTGDIDAFSKWMLGWVDNANITAAVTSDEGIDVRHGTKDVKHFDASITETLESFATAQPGQTGNLIAVSSDQSVLEGNLFCNFYLLQYASYTGNDSVAFEGTPIMPGFRIFRVQAGLNEYGTFIHSNTYGVAHGQLIEALLPQDGGATWEFGNFYHTGMTLSPQTTPSSNFGENPLMGYSGVAVEILDNSETAGSVRLSQAERPELPNLEITSMNTLAFTNSGELTFALNRAVGTNPAFDSSDVKIVVKNPAGSDGSGNAGGNGSAGNGGADGSSGSNDNTAEYAVEDVTYQPEYNLLTVRYRLDATAVQPGAQVALKLPAGYFALAYNAGNPTEFSEEITLDLPAPRAVDLEEGIYQNVCAAAGEAHTLSDIFDVNGKQYFFQYHRMTDEQHSRVSLCGLDETGTVASETDIPGASDLPAGRGAVLQPAVLSDGTAFVRISTGGGYESITELWVDVETCALKARWDAPFEELTGQSVQVFPTREGVALASKASDGSWIITEHRLAVGEAGGADAAASADARETGDMSAQGNAAAQGGGTISANSTTSATFGQQTVNSLINAGDGYVCAISNAAETSRTSSVLLWKTSDIADSSSLGAIEPALRLSVAYADHIEGVRAAGNRVYVFSSSHEGESPNAIYQSELTTFSMAGELLQRTQTPLLAFSFFRQTDIRVSENGRIALISPPSNNAVASWQRHVVILDASQAELGQFDAYTSVVGTWAKERWINPNTKTARDTETGRIPTWWLATKTPAEDEPGEPAGPSDPSEPGNPGEPAAPSNPGGSGGINPSDPATSGDATGSGENGSATSASAGDSAPASVPNTGDHARAIEALCVAAAALLAITATALVRKKRRQKA